MQRHKRYVVAFNRDRDFYQLPLALAEAGRLEALITDLYVPDALAGGKLSEAMGLTHRRVDGLPSKLVRSSATALLLQTVGLKFARTDRARNLLFNRLDAGLSSKAGRIALARGAHAFLYSGYALEAFEMLQGTDTRRLLFVYHPQGDYVQAILEEDFSRHPEVAASHQRHIEEITINEGDRVAREIKLATEIVCASTFTAQSVKACLGSKGTRVTTVPYGCFTAVAANRPDDRRERGKPRVLFVGQGTQRKGLHHLIKAWSQKLGEIADLTLVVNSLDPGIGRMMEALPDRPKVLTALSRDSLESEFAAADIFVLPSLVEGFGLVYLEALSAGCFVIGTQNTGLPDLRPPADVAAVLPAGDSEALRETLEKSIMQVRNGSISRGEIRAFAAAQTWTEFRKGIINVVQRADSESAKAT